MVFEVQLGVSVEVDMTAEVLEEAMISGLEESRYP
jgi:hypothetical protein